MSPEKDTYTPGQAYVALSRVRELDKLHIVNYTRTQIQRSPTVADEMKRLRTNLLPQTPPHLFQIVTQDMLIFSI